MNVALNWQQRNCHWLRDQQTAYKERRGHLPVPDEGIAEAAEKKVDDKHDQHKPDDTAEASAIVVSATVSPKATTTQKQD